MTTTSEASAARFSDLSDAYYSSCDFEDDPTCAKARTHRTAIAGLLAYPTLSMTTAAGGQHQVMFDRKSLADELQFVRRWIRANDPNATNRQSEFAQLITGDIKG